MQLRRSINLVAWQRVAEGPINLFGQIQIERKEHSTLVLCVKE